MVEVLEARCWEATGPCRAARSFPGVVGAGGRIAERQQRVVRAVTVSVRTRRGDVVVDPSGLPVFSDRLPLAEPFRGSNLSSEAGECNVAKRRHGRPCCQKQSLDEAHGHRPQGTTSPRLGVSCCRRCRCFRAPGVRYYCHQRTESQSVRVT